MPPSAIPALLLAILAPTFAGADDQRGPPGPPPGPTVTQWSFQEHIVIHVPRVPERATPAPAAAPVRWREKKGPHCLPLASMAGAVITSPSQIDLVLAGGKRVRAKLDGQCQPLDYYSGFFIRPTADGQICADRDAIRVRSGASCGIGEFRTLVVRK
jgi:hypothetical protein